MVSGVVSTVGAAGPVKVATDASGSQASLEKNGFELSQKPLQAIASTARAEVQYLC
jgi:hypothetical protein